jgi:hypothetical protein
MNRKLLLQVTIKFFKNYKLSLVFPNKKFIFEKLDCHLQYIIDIIHRSIKD